MIKLLLAARVRSFERCVAGQELYLLQLSVIQVAHRVEEIEDKLMQRIRYLDKLVDEPAKGKAMGKILRR